MPETNDNRYLYFILQLGAVDITYMLLCIHTRTTWQKDKIWQEILIGHPIGLVSNRPIEHSVGRFEARPIRFYEPKIQSVD
jgi:hypothetical protein